MAVENHQDAVPPNKNTYTDGGSAKLGTQSDFTFFHQQPRFHRGEHFAWLCLIAILVAWIGRTLYLGLSQLNREWAFIGFAVLLFMSHQFYKHAIRKYWTPPEGNAIWVPAAISQKLQFFIALIVHIRAWFLMHRDRALLPMHRLYVTAQDAGRTDYGHCLPEGHPLCHATQDLPFIGLLHEVAVWNEGMPMIFVEGTYRMRHLKGSWWMESVANRLIRPTKDIFDLKTLLQKSKCRGMHRFTLIVETSLSPFHKTSLRAYPMEVRDGQFRMTQQVFNSLHALSERRSNDQAASR